MVGVPIPADQLELAATRLQEMFDIDEVLKGLELNGFDPAQVYDPSWTEERSA
jgi:hypothetical protein